MQTVQVKEVAVRPMLPVSETQHQTQLLTKYIATWAWQIIAIIFLAFCIAFFKADYMDVAIAFLFLFALSEFMSWKRQSELREEESYG